MLMVIETFPMLIDWWENKCQRFEILFSQGAILLTIWICKSVEQMNIDENIIVIAMILL